MMPGSFDLTQTLKRKVGYEDEEIRSTGERLQRMDIEDSSNHTSIGPQVEMK
jgi:hypothetical protein